MFTVILPTLWKLNYKEELQKIHDSSFVGELILINNDRNNTPEWFTGMHLPKLIDVRPDVNIYVNPAWNMGVRMAKYEHCLLFSDDVVIDSYDFLSTTDEYLLKHDSLIGCSEQCYKVGHTENFEIVDESGNRPYGYGCVMAFRKNSYRPIPDCYKIWHGDNLLYRRYRDTMPDGAKSFKNLGMKATQFSVSCLIYRPICDGDDGLDFEGILREYVK